MKKRIEELICFNDGKEIPSCSEEQEFLMKDGTIKIIKTFVPSFDIRKEKEVFSNESEEFKIRYGCCLREGYDKSSAYEMAKKWQDEDPNNWHWIEEQN